MTEKDYNPKQKEMKSIKKLEVSNKIKKPEKVEAPKEKKPMKKQEKIESPKKEAESNKREEKSTEEVKKESPKTQEKEIESNKTEEKPTEEKPVEAQEKKPEKKPETSKVKKTEALVNVSNFPISRKSSSAVCKFIKNKKIEVAIKELEEVRLKKRAIPSKGEIAHKKGKGMSSGIFATKTVTHFILLLKSLLANSNELENPVISEAIANIGSRPYGRFGRTRKKRTHIKIIAKESKPKEKTNKKEVEKK